jgi:hypothetical protein
METENFDPVQQSSRAVIQIVKRSKLHSDDTEDSLSYVFLRKIEENEAPETL